MKGREQEQPVRVKANFRRIIDSENKVARWGLRNYAFVSPVGHYNFGIILKTEWLCRLFPTSCERFSAYLFYENSTVKLKSETCLAE